MNFENDGGTLFNLTGNTSRLNQYTFGIVCGDFSVTSIFCNFSEVPLWANYTVRAI